jgi:glycosyltransferase involved in cell wall biosynthesis
LDLPTFNGRVGLQQRVLPDYRIPFFDFLAAACRGGLSVFAGQPAPDESIPTTDQLLVARHQPAANRQFFRAGHPLFLCWQPGLLSWLQEWDPQVLIAEANPRYRTTPRAVQWMRNRGRPVIGWGLGAPSAAGPLGGLRIYGREPFLRSFDAIIAYSQRGARQYQALGIPPERIHVAVNAVAAQPQETPPERPPRFGKRPAVLFVGRLQARKRIDLLLEACARLPEAMQPALVVVGDGPARGELEHLAKKIYPRAVFPGSVHGAELKPFFRQADLFVLPGTGGLAVQEAMAHGLPVIVAAGDGTQEDLVRPENGWILPPGDLGALSEALRQALSDADSLRQRGRESFRIVRFEVNLQEMVAVFVRALNQVWPE